MHFLAADQFDNRVRLFSDEVNEENELIQKSVWRFPGLNRKIRFRPTDAKRVDIGGKIKVIIATHGYVSEVPYQWEASTIVARTFRSCHSVERLPDGNLVSANSKHNKLSIHHRPRKLFGITYLKRRNNFPLNFAHGVVYDKKRQCLWALGQDLRRYEYVGGQNPKLILQKSYKLPYLSGHDLFPTDDGKLLLTFFQGVYQFDIDSEDLDEIAAIKKVKSVVKQNGAENYFITNPMDIAQYARWQTHTIKNISSGEEFKRPTGKFYKVRLWEKNNFSY